MSQDKSTTPAATSLVSTDNSAASAQPTNCADTTPGAVCDGHGTGKPCVTMADHERISRMLRQFGDQHDHDEFDTPMARSFSRYCAPLKPDHDGNRARGLTLYRLRADEQWPTEQDEHAEPWAQTVHDMLRSHITGEFFPCPGARAAFMQCTYRVGYYQEMAHPSAVAAMGRDLLRFIKEYEQLGDFATFVSLFKYPQSTSEDQFEEKLFQHLQMLHDGDKSDWDPHYSPDPENPQFAFSFGGCAFIVVGMHSGASRLSRGLFRPALIFNPESQIRRLQRAGLLDNFARQARARDTRYQGGINPSLPADHRTTGGEARVYSGKRHPEGEPFKCPFHPRPELLEAARAADKKDKE